MKPIYCAIAMLFGMTLLGCDQTSSTAATAPANTQASTQISTQTANNSNSQNTQTEITEFSSQLPDSAPTLKVATEGYVPPFSFQDEYGNLQGIDIDVIRAIGESQGFRVDFYKEKWQNLFASVDSGRRDLAISGISYSDERAQKYGLSTPYFFNPSAIMYTNPQLSIHGLQDLSGLKVASMQGTKQFKQLQQMGATAEIVPQPTSFKLFEALMQGKVDATVDDLPLLKYTVANHPDKKVIIVPYEDESNPSAQQVILMAKDNVELIEKINAGIAALKATNELQKIEEKWLSATATETPASVSDASPVTNEGK